MAILNKTSRSLGTNAQIKSPKKEKGLIDKIQSDFDLNQSYINLILGALIVVVLGVLVFNYFNRSNETDLGPSQQISDTTQGEDVTKDNLPGKYTVKEGDTLFLIAQSYYGDGYKYPEIVKANNITNENILEIGQVLEIPKLEETLAFTSPSPQTSPQPMEPETRTQPVEGGVGGAENQTIWGERITSDTYTVVQGDWLSKIAGRAYGDIMSYDKIAKINNIQNPDVIEPGMVLKIPR